MNELLSAIARSTQSTEESEGRDFGFHVGVVTSVDDPKSIGRVRARFAAMGSNDESDWLCPMWSGSIEGIAHVNDTVIVAFIDGNPNRGLFWVSPRTGTGGRPTEPMLLGLAFLKLYNDLVEKFNSLKATFNALVAKHNTHTHAAGALLDSLAAPVTGTTGAPVLTASTDSDDDAAKGKSHDGSTPAASAVSVAVLSARAKVGD